MLEPMEATAIEIPNVIHPISDEVTIVSDNQSKCSSDSQFSLMVAEKKDVNSQWVKTGRIPLLNSHKKTILYGDQLDDAIMSLLKRYLKSSSPTLMGYKIHCYKQRNRLTERNHSDYR